MNENSLVTAWRGGKQASNGGGGDWRTIMTSQLGCGKGNTVDEAVSTMLSIREVFT